MNFPVLAGRRIVVFDLETTGFSPNYGDRVVEIGAVALKEKCIIAEFDSPIRIRKIILPHVPRIGGITNDVLAREIIDNLESALEQFNGIQDELKGQ